MSFALRHIGNTTKKKQIKEMLKRCDVKSVDELVKKTNIKQNFKITNKTKKFIPLVSEIQSHQNLKNIMDKNKHHTSYLGYGYYNTITPSPIKRHILENPQWYSAYTPYQSEISQGRLESQYNFQEVVKELTKLPIANASLLDEASAAGEALNLSYAYYRKKRNKFLVGDDLHPQTLDVLETRAKTLNLHMHVIDLKKIYNFDNFIDHNEYCNFIFQYPNTMGDIYVPFSALEFANNNNILKTGITDLLALTKIITPGELNLNIALGNCQRFGIPLWYGGPHPAFFAVSPELLRLMPGRIIAKSKDKCGKEVFRLALQTREQHIKKQTATSNICTSQSLLTNVVSLYSIYNGPKKLKKISQDINNKAKYFIEKLQHTCIANDSFYDTISIKVKDTDKLVKQLKKHDILVRKNKDSCISITFSEIIEKKDIDKLISLIKKYDGHIFEERHSYYYQLHDRLRRKTPYLTSDIFNKYHTETELVRYMYHLASKDYTLCNGMIPLGSCTMKLNSVYQLEPLMWDKVADIHPFVPEEYALGYKELINDTGDYLKFLTGFKHISFQPNSGATGEYTGLLCIKKYHHSRNDDKRNICLIPKSAHGTNFASASVANLKVETFCDSLLENLEEFDSFVEKYKDNLSCLMITYPNTNGVFQKNIIKINDIIHKHGGLVYMDGANMNALVGYFKPNNVGFDVCHLNLHKTFCIPHGGGGPGLGPILCNDKLAAYLPQNKIQNKIDNINNINSCGSVSASNWSSAALITIPYLYISAMGLEGLKKATKMAILNSNYLKNSLKDYFKIKDVNEHGMVGHEFIVDVSEYREYGITENDIAKRLIDYSFHPPTMSWPRGGVLMFEPTESESKEELDRLIIAMKSIKNELEEIKEGTVSKDNNLLKNAPHCMEMVENWKFPYSIKDAFYPVEYLKKKKFNVPVGRVDDVYGDKVLLKQNN